MVPSPVGSEACSAAAGDRGGGLPGDGAGGGLPGDGAGDGESGLSTESFCMCDPQALVFMKPHCVNEPGFCRWSPSTDCDGFLCCSDAGMSQREIPGDAGPAFLGNDLPTCV